MLSQKLLMVSAVASGGGYNLLYIWGYNQYGQLGTNSLYESTNFVQFSPTVVPGSWSSLSAGANYTLGIKTNGKLFAWGQNTIGQLGDQTLINKSSPVQIGTDNWSAISAGESHSMAVKNDGTLWAWGSNDSGQLGLNYTSLNLSVTKLAASVSNMIVIDSSGGLFTWGINTNGQIGDGTTILRSFPVQVGSSSWTQVTSTNNDNLTLGAIRNDGGLFIWGSNSNGTFGDNTTISRSSPIQIGTSSWTQLSTSISNTAAIRSDGALFMWGDNTNGLLGATPTSWTQISVGLSITMGIRSDGLLYVWGYGANSALGTGSTNDKSIPFLLGTSTWSQVSASAYHALAIRSDGMLFGWGYAPSGEIFFDSNNINSPVMIGTSSWSQVSSQASYTMAIRSDGRLFTWGWGPNLGFYSENTSWSYITVGTSSTFAIKSNGSLWAWGAGAGGALGTADVINRSAPQQIGTSSWTTVSSNGSTTAAIRADGALFTWGLNNNGQLLTISGATYPNFPSLSSPTQIGTSSWSQVSISTSTYAAIRSDGALFTWGFNNNGQLGFVNPSYSYSVVSTGVSNTLLIRNDGMLFSAGNNTYGQLGDATTINKSTPIQVGNSSWIAAAAGTTSLAIRYDGALFAWGLGTSGQTGVGTTITNNNSPLQLGTSSWTAVAGGNSLQSLAIRSDGALFAWGVNSGRLGDNAVSSKSSPVQIGTSSWTAVTAGISNTFAIRSDGALFGWGANSFGQLGTSSKTFSKVALGYVYSLTIDSTGIMYGVGANQYGQLGLNNTNAVSVLTAIGSNSWTQVTTASDSGVNYPTNLAIRSDGALFAWGYGDNYQLGIGSSVTRSSPVQIGTSSWTSVGLGVGVALAVRADGALFWWGSGSLYGNGSIYQAQYSWTSISAGGALNTAYYLAIRSDGALYAWGFNSTGQLGDGTGTDKSVPTLVSNSSWSAVSASIGNVSMAIRSDGMLFTWGSSTSGRLGNDGATTIDRSTPTQISGSSWVTISSGGNISAALRVDGALFTWGLNTIGQIGDGTTITKSSPVQVGTSSWTALSVGASSVAAIRSDGRLFTWGNNQFGQLGSSLYSWKLIVPSRNGSHTVAIRSDGALFGWGLNSSGQLGLNNATANITTPTVIDQVASWTAVASGSTHTVALKSTGALFVWGGNSTGQLGDGTTITRSSPVQLGTSSWLSVAAAAGGTYAVKLGRTLFSWGSSTNGELGQANTINRSSPTQIGTSSWSLVDSGYSAVAAIRTDGSLYMWGANPQGQLGDGSTVTRSSPVQLGTSSWSLVSAGFSATSAIRTDGGLFTWGVNTQGQLGDGTTINSRSSPIQIGSSSWSSISSGYSHMMATRIDKMLFVWGSNSSGQFGDGTTINKSSPVQIGTYSYTSIAAGGQLGSVSAGIRNDFVMLNWGNNAGYKLGVGDQVSRSTPVQISVNYSLSSPTQVGTSSWSAVSSGGTHTVAIRSDSSLFTWGLNLYGQMGSPDTGYNEVSPTQIGTSSWSNISAGNLHTLALRNDKVLFVWGNNVNGQLGDGSYINWSSPTQIGTSSWSAISAGPSYSGVINSNNILYTAGRPIGTGIPIGEFALGTISTNLTQPSPTQIGTSSWTSVAGIRNNLQFNEYAPVFAIRNDGALFSWGSNYYGQLGYTLYDSSWSLIGAGGGVIGILGLQNTDLYVWGGLYSIIGTTWVANPTLVGISAWTALSVTSAGIGAVRSDGALFTWGTALPGNNTLGVRSSPVQIGTSSWSNVSISTSAMAAIRTDGALFVWGINLDNTTNIVKSSPVQIGTSSWSSISAGVSTIAAIRTDGALFAWGLNSNGQLGDGTTISKSSPVQLGSSSWSVVSAGNSSISALRTDGAIFIWGGNSTGQLGDGTTLDKSSPVQLGTSSWTSVSGTYTHLIASRTDGALFAWGSNSSGELGDSTTINKSSPIQIGSNSWSIVTAGQAITAALDASTKVGYAWGSNGSNYLLGIGDTINRSSPVQVSVTKARSSPVQVGTNSWNSISIGPTTVLGLSSNNLLFAWGTNSGGQLGNGTTLNELSPTQIGTSSWTQIAASKTQGAIRSDGALFTWGSNSYGNLGDGTTIDKSSPVQIGTDSWAMVNVEMSNTTAGIKTNGTAYMWGYGSQTWGNFFVTNASSPTQIGVMNPITYSPIQIGTSSWIAVSANNAQHILAIRSDGALFGWGNNAYGQTGTGYSVYTSLVSPTQVDTNSYTMVNATAQAADSTLGFSLFKRTDGSLWGVGYNAQGQLGDGTTVNKSSQVQIGTSSWVSLSAAESSSIGLLNDKTVFAWGQNILGQFGIGTTFNRSTPTQVYLPSATQSSPVQIGTSSWSSVSAGINMYGAIRKDGGLFTWGSNSSGGLGQGDTIDRSSPTQMGTNSWVSVSVYSNTNMVALQETGSAGKALFTWGSNTTGQLGDNTAISKSSPTQIGSNTWTYAYVNGASTFVYALDTSKLLYAWGSNSGIALGLFLPTSVNFSSPVQIAATGINYYSYTMVAGNTGAIALRSDGSLYIWGSNGSGQLGDGTTVAKLGIQQLPLVISVSSPTQVGTSSWTSISAGFTHSLAVRNDGALFGWGNNLYNQLGSTLSWRMISGGEANPTLLLSTQGQLYAMALTNTNGLIGDGTTISKSRPVQISTASWIYVSTGAASFAIKDDYTLWGWGTAGLVGDNTNVAKSSPVQIGTSSWLIVDSSGFTSHTMAVRIDGALFTWGSNVNGQLGDNTSVTRSSPTQIGTDSWTVIHAGQTSAIRSDGALFTWGSGDFGMLGTNTGSTTARSSPTQIGTSSWTALNSTAGSSGFATGAIRSDGLLFAWGQNNLGGLGDGTSINRSSPVQIGSSSWVAVAITNGYSLGITANETNKGNLYTWGVGNNQSTNFGILPTITSWTSVTAGSSFALALRTDGALFGWGLNLGGSVGTNDSQGRSVPTQITTTDSYILISAAPSAQASFAIRNDGALFAWGTAGTSGGLGTNNTATYSSPVQVGTSSWVFVNAGVGLAANRVTGYGIGSTGKLFTWGTNTQGELGDGTTINKSSPVQIDSGSWINVAGAYGLSLAIRYDGALFAWGNAGSGLGDGTTINKSSPVQLGTSSWTQVSVSSFASAFAIRSDGALFAWGYGGAGNLGNNLSTVGYSSPVQIGTSSWTSVVASQFNSFAIRSDGTLWSWGNNSTATFGMGITGVIGFSSPIQIGSSSWTKIGLCDLAGAAAVYGITTSGSLYSWGVGSVSQLGDGASTNRSYPMQINPPYTPFTPPYNIGLLDNGYWSSVKITLSGATGIKTTAGGPTTGDWYTWGLGYPGSDLTYPTLSNVGINLSSPTQIGTSSWGNINAGTYASYAIRKDGALFTWGLNTTSGQLGSGTTVNRVSPVQLGTGSWTSVSSTQSSIPTVNAGVTSDGTLLTWGRLVGGLGYNGIASANYLDPMILGTGYKNAVVDTTGSLAVAITTTNLAFMWGTGGYYTAGTVTVLGKILTPISLYVSTSSPIQIGTSSWSAVALSTSAASALRTDGALFTWGGNPFGELGNNTYFINFSSPTQVGTSSWTQISAASNTMGALRADNALFTWGYNVSGQLGDATQVDKSSPVQIGTSSWTSVSVGGYTTAAIRTDGALFIWGSNTFGAYGNLTTQSRSSPIQISAGESWSQIKLTNLRSAGTLITNSIYTWGNNANGELGQGNRVSTSSPVQLGVSANSSSPVQIGTSGWIKISAGASHSVAIRGDNKLFTWGNNTNSQLAYGVTLSWTVVVNTLRNSAAIRSDGALFTWGDNISGQLGNNNSTITSRNSPVQLGTSRWTQVATPMGANSNVQNMIAIRSDGALFAWGANNTGQLGDGTTINKSSPTQIGTSSWTFVYTGGAVNVGSFAIRSDGALFAWGYNGSNYLGDGTSIDKSSPVLISSGNSWTSVNSNTYSGAALRIDGALFTWGNNVYGGTGSYTSMSVPTQIGTSSWTQISSIGQGTLQAIRYGGSLFTWGYNANGQMGDGTTINKSSPTQIGTSSWTSVSGGLSTTSAIKSNGTLWTWGPNTDGSLGDGTTINKSSPIQVGANSWTLLPTTGSTAGISFGTLYVWGNNNSVQIGDSTSINKSSPVQIGTLPQLLTPSLSSPSQVGSANWAEISAGVVHNLAIDATGKLYGWGNNFNRPVGVIPVQSWVSVVTGSYSSNNTAFALRSDGRLFAWGQNPSGTLGLNDAVATYSYVPQPVGASSWTQISAANSMAIAIRADGALFTWGSNLSGGLGTNDTTTRSSPVQIGTSSWSFCTTGGQTQVVAAIRTDGALFVWGNTNFGSIGDSTTINKSSPVQIGTGSWNIVNVGTSTVIGIRSNNTLWAWGGGGGSGAVGANNTVAYSSPVQLGTSSWSNVFSGYNMNAAIRIDGALFTWGSNGSLGLGTNDSVNRSSPTQIGTSSWTQLAGYFAGVVLGLRVDGALFAWGSNINGATGLNNTTAQSSPVQVGTSSWTSVTNRNANGSQIVAIRADNSIFMWGDINFLLNDGSDTIRSSPVQLGLLISYSSPSQIGTSNWSEVAAGGTHSAAIRSDGALFTWGSNSYGQLGYNDMLLYLSSPTQIGTSSWSAITAGNVSTDAVRIGGTLFTWGSNFYGGLGQANSGYINQSWTIVTSTVGGSSVIRSDGMMFSWGSTNTVILQPVATSRPTQIGGTTSWSMVKQTQAMAVALTNTGALFVWGTANNLGDGTTLARSSPIQLGTSSWTMATAGGITTNASGAAIRIDGSLYVWGSNGGGQMGVNDTNTKLSPVQVGTSSWSTVAAGPSHMVAIRNDGTLWSWGSTQQGQLGLNSSVSRSSPTQIGTSSWTYVAATGPVGGGWSAAIRADGALFVWGDGTSGQIGNLTANTNHSSPVQLGTSSWSMVAANFLSVAAIRIDGALFTWGFGTSGQLGLNSSVNISSPTQVGTSSWSNVGTGSSFMIAVRSDGALFAWGNNTSTGILGNGSSALGGTSSPVQLGVVVSNNIPIIQSSPVQIGTSSWSGISAGSQGLFSLGFIQK